MKKYQVDPLLMEKILRKSDERVQSSIKNMEFTKKWLTIATNDIEICKILYDLKHYAGSAYHLQQAFEKLTKSYYIFIGRIDPHEAYKHSFILDKLKKEIKEEDINDITEVSNIINDVKIDLEVSKKGLETLEKTEDELRNISESHINFILEFLKNSEKNLKSEETMKNLNERVHEKSFISFIKHMLFRITTFRIRDSDVRASIESYKLEEYVIDMMISFKLHYLSLITFLHFNTPRYPYTKDSNLNFFDYNENLPIVKAIPVLIKTFNEIKLNIEKTFLKEVDKSNVTQ
ncbi:MAG: HEPN domain-containing protein [Nanoarchaeota archaeon]